VTSKGTFTFIVNMHYIFFTSKQAVLSKSKHSGNNAPIIGASSPSLNTKCFRTRINGDLCDRRRLSLVCRSWVNEMLRQTHQWK